MVVENITQLNKEYLRDNLLGTELADYSVEIMEYPERVVQFGEGNFLRAFVDWMFHQMNKAGLFKGRVVVVQPISQGRVSNLLKQDSLYTLLLRGKKNNKIINQREVMTGISRGLEAYSQWDKVLQLAENPDIEFVVSNTTEAGIVYSPEDSLTDNPPDSFPGKLTAYLYHRFKHFNGDMSKGMVIIPVELIDRNGDILKKIVLRLADDWNLDERFWTWVENANIFLNTLVDRIVTGYPFREIKKIEKELRYHDENLDTGENFHLWVIEGDKALKERLPFHKIGLNVKWVTDMTPYRNRKVRILNGAHTSSVPVAYLSGIDLVRDAVNDEFLGRFMRKVIFENILPSMDMPVEELEAFAEEVLERFANPFIDHKCLDISLNCISKYRTRVLPSLLKYMDSKKELPTGLVFSLAALIYFYRGTVIKNNQLLASRNGEEYLIKDDIEVLEFFANIWDSYQDNKISIDELAKAVLGIDSFWGQDLNKEQGLSDMLVYYLKEIESDGIRKSLIRFLEK